MEILIDTRERSPFTFESMRRGQGDNELIKLARASLKTGDYSLGGLADKIAIERKSLADLVGCLAAGRERFTAELWRGQALDVFCVVVEAAWEQLAEGAYKSRLNPHAACQSIASFMARFNTPFYFAGTREAAEYLTYSILRQYLEVARKRWKSILQAHGSGGREAA